MLCIHWVKEPTSEGRAWVAERAARREEEERKTRLAKTLEVVRDKASPSKTGKPKRRRV